VEATHGHDVVVVLGLLIVVAVVAAAVRVVRIPYTVALVLAGLALALSPHAPRFTLTPDIILTVFLPVLLFYGAYTVNIADLRANLVPITLLALPGVIATAGLVGAAQHLAAGLSWTTALLFGTMVDPTIPWLSSRSSARWAPRAASPPS
jgi:CPA1 family monovalent cation:H+ antiporter